MRYQSTFPVLCFKDYRPPLTHVRAESLSRLRAPRRRSSGEWLDCGWQSSIQPKSLAHSFRELLSSVVISQVLPVHPHHFAIALIRPVNGAK